MHANMLQEINSRVDIKDVARYLGLNVNHTGFISCPLHSERTASCKLYDTSFYCYGCNRWGDSIDLVSTVRGMSLMDAAKELNSYFGLGIDLNRHTKEIRRKSPTSLKQIEAEQVRRQVDAIAYTAREARRHGFPEDSIVWFDEVHQAMIEDDRLRLTDPAKFLNKYRKEFERYADIRSKYQRIRTVVSGSRDYPFDEVRAILGQA